MIDVNNLLNRLKCDQRLIASHIILLVNDSNDKEKVFYIDKICSDMFICSDVVFKTLDKLAISEIVSIEKVRPKVYKIKPLCKKSFKLAAEVLEGEYDD